MSGERRLIAASHGDWVKLCGGRPLIGQALRSAARLRKWPRSGHQEWQS